MFDDVDKLEVSIGDGKRYAAKVVQLDEAAGLALIKIQADFPLPFAALGDAAELLVGEAVGIAGGAQAQDGMISKTTVSAVHRKLCINDEVCLENLIQLDDVASPGDSGGALFNRKGELVGIVLSIRDQDQQGGLCDTK